LALVLAWFALANAPLQFEPVLAAPSLAGRLDSVFRDSLRARGVDLFPLDSLARLRERGEWPTGEKTPSNLAKLKTLTKREVVGWVRVDMPNPDFRRYKWFPLWASREWVIRGEVFKSGAGAPEVDRFSFRKETSLGFVGTWGAEQFPPSSADVRKALDVLSPEVASRVATFLAGEASPK
jgi:hypothetical protein